MRIRMLFAAAAVVACFSLMSSVSEAGGRITYYSSPFPYVGPAPRVYSVPAPVTQPCTMCLHERVLRTRPGPRRFRLRFSHRHQSWCNQLPLTMLPLCHLRTTLQAESSIRAAVTRFLSSPNYKTVVKYR